MKVVKGNVESAKRVAQYLYKKYSDMGYVVRPSCEMEAYALHIRSDESGLSGTLDGIAGTDMDIVVRIRSVDRYVSVEASGCYKGKVARLVICTFAAGGLGAAPVGCGCFLQWRLANAIENDAEEFLQNCKCGAIPYTRSNFTIAG